MKIETTTNSHRGNKVKFTGGILVTFDERGVADVPEQVGQFLIEKYSGLFPAGQVPAPGVKPTPVASGAVAELNEKLHHADRLRTDAEAQAKKALDGERAWRDKCDDLIKENIALKAQIKELSEACEHFKQLAEELGAKDIDPEKKDGDQVSGAGNESGAGVGNDQNKVMTPEEVAALREKLDAKFTKELIAMAEELGLPVVEYEKLKKSKQKFIDYLLGKITAPQAGE